MTKMTDDTIGIDISKATLDIHRLSDGKTMSFSNCPAGFKALSRFCAKTAVARVVYEATGAYHSGLERALGAHLPLVKVNPLQARRFAQAQGLRAKTDAVDAKMLADMGNAFALEPDEPAAEIQHDLKELRSFRSGLIKDRTGIMSRMKTQTLSITRRQSKARLAQVDKQIAEINAEIERLINSSDKLAHSMKILRSIPGVGAICAATILIEMPETGSMDRKQVASLTGLAPMTRQSGQWRGKSFIQGGRKIVRDALYMPALVAMRHNPDFKAKYQALIKAGKPPKVAITALMRKLIELANALIKADRNWVTKGA
ncbi:putative IS110 family transposase [Octadecabacter arcticus 238]|uniref:Putative IS110 family transposase n=2 Tax=Octadecabacter arcticus 238 TaxID=391616 RepID=B5K129_9RHOB|nr:putative IS110 family transposase [Octadecabacter arcticus 238]